MSPPISWVVRCPATYSRVNVVAATRERALLAGAELLGSPIDQLVITANGEW
jgi:hypothetical protein